MPKDPKPRIKERPPSLSRLRFDEVNVGRLGLISIQERIPADYVEWDVELDFGGTLARLQCQGVAKLGVPHGLDNDVSSGLISLYLEAGSPEDGWFHTTAYRLLKRAGLHTGGKYYEALHESLRRLRGSTYYASDSWYDVRRHYVTASFNYIEGLEYSSEDEVGLTQGSVLRVKLARPIIASIRARMLRELDQALLERLERPLTRALYRLLEGRRLDPDGSGELAMVLTMDLRGWGRQCKIVDEKPVRIRRTLDPAHEELVSGGYLHRVEYGGPRNAQTVTYHFRDAAGSAGDDAATRVVPDPELVSALVKYGVARGPALGLLERYGEERVRARLRKFEALMRGGYRPKKPSGLLVDVIRDEDGKYPDDTPELLAVPAVPAPSVAARAVARAESSEVERRAQEDEQDAEARLRAQPLEERVDAAMRSAQLLIAGQFTTAEYARLRALLASERLDPVDFGKRVVAAGFNRSLGVLVRELRDLLDSSGT